MAATCKLARAATQRAAQLGGECGRGSLEDERPRVGPAATSRAKKACRRQRHVTHAWLSSNLKAPCRLQHCAAMAAVALQGSLGTPCAWWKEPCILGALACGTLRRSLAKRAVRLTPRPQASTRQAAAPCWAPWCMALLFAP